MSKIHLASISNDLRVQARLKDTANEFDFNCQNFTDADLYMEATEHIRDANVTLLSFLEGQSAGDITGTVQVVKCTAANTFIIIIVNKKISPEDIDFIKKSGANLVLNESDFIETSFIEYALLQLIKGSLIPVKGCDFQLETSIDFKVMAILPLNKKVIPVIFPSEIIRQGKFDKIKGTKELYIYRDDLGKLQTYMSSNKDSTADGVASRCRVNYLYLCKTHADLVFSLFDRSSAVTFSLGKSLLDACVKIASEMLSSLGALEDPWRIINNNSFSETSSIERTPSIAAMAGLVSINLSSTNTENTIVSGLLSDIGLVTLSPSITKKIRQKKWLELTNEEMTYYYQHPNSSVNKCLEKRLPLSEDIKHIIMTTHERFDKQGFPNKISTDKIPKESQILQFCEFIDQKIQIKMGESSGKNSKQAQLEAIEAELMSKKILDLALAYKIKTYLSIIDSAQPISVAS